MLQAQGNPAIFNIIFLVAIIFVMYFFFMRPQIKKQKEQDNFSKELKPGQKIVTTSGIIGKISKINKESVVIITDGKTSMKLLPSAISKELTATVDKGEKA